MASKAAYYRVAMGRLERAYNQVPRILSAMKHNNLGLRWYPYVGRIVMDMDGVPKHVL